MSRKRPPTLPRAENARYSSAQTVAVDIVRQCATTEAVTCSGKRKDGETGYAWKMG